MSEGGSAPAFLDARHYTYLPGWAKGAVLAAAGLVLLLSATLLCRALLSQEQGDHVLFYLSLAQTAALVLVFGVILMFSTRDANAANLQRLSDAFITRYVADALARVSLPAKGIAGFNVVDLGRKDIFGRSLEMRADGHAQAFPLWVGLNVSRIFVIYFVPLAEGTTVERVREVFQFTFGGARKVGFHVNFEPAMVDGRPVVSVWLNVAAGGELLYSPREKLFWAQDIAMMTESFLRTAHRAGIALAPVPTPGPL